MLIVENVAHPFADIELPEEITCPLCGVTYPREMGEVGPHFTVIATRPIQVTPRCLPGAQLSWTGVVLHDALSAATRSLTLSP